MVTKHDNHASPFRTDRYEHVETEDGLYIYDREEENAWIQSDYAITLNDD